jgi:hypothetical protein
MVTVLIFSAFPINAGSDDVTPMGSGSEPTSSPDEFRIWEAYAKGDLTISSSSDRLSFIITNTGSENITIDEYVLLMSPNPYQSPLENPTGTKWTQDGSLTFNYLTITGIMWLGCTAPQDLLPHGGAQRIRKAQPPMLPLN